MILSAYAQASPPGLIQLWVGMFGTEQPPSPLFFIDQQPAMPLEPVSMLPIRDRQVGAGGQALNHQNVFRFAVRDGGGPHLVRVEADGQRREFTTNSLPARIPQTMEDSFNVLLCSCYSQPDDVSGLLGTIVSQIKLQPQLTVLAGDQVYLDLPLLEDLPEQEPALSRALSEKYLRNWASTGLDVPGLETLLTRAPVVCVPDDHEFWNNFPFPQKQLPNTWKEAVRERWKNAAQNLYEDFQIGGAQTKRAAVRIDVEPLKMLFVDMRCERDNRFRQLMNPEASAALTKWADDLIAACNADGFAAGVLCSGQALFIDPPTEERKMRDVDAEMGNYAQFQFVQQELARLADKGIPVVYLTGDVHWGRVASALDMTRSRTLLYEVICSPSRLIRVPFLDSAKESVNAVKGLFGAQDPWPRHSEPEQVPDRFGLNRRFKLQSEFAQRGDQVAVISFSRAGSGVDFCARYYAIHPDKSISQSRPTANFQLRVTQ